jgi:hypothetical protein
MVAVFFVSSLAGGAVISRAAFLAIRGDCRTNCGAYAAAHDRPFAATDLRADRCTYSTTDRPSEDGVTIDSKKGRTW